MGSSAMNGCSSAVNEGSSAVNEGSSAVKEGSSVGAAWFSLEGTRAGEHVCTAGELGERAVGGELGERGGELAWRRWPTRLLEQLLAQVSVEGVQEQLGRRIR